MPSLWNLEFADHNANRRYPLADDASARDTTGSFEIPDNFLVGCDLPISAAEDVDPARFFILQIGAYATGYTIVIGYQPADLSDPFPVATALVPRQGFARDTAFRLGGGTSFEDSLGKVVIGRLDDIDLQPPGQWTFTLETARLDPDAVRPMLRGVSSLVCVNGTQRSAPLTGIVELVAYANMRIDPIIVSGQNPVVRFSAISGEGTIEDCVCEGDAAPTEPIRSIDGVLPTADGAFYLVGSNCVQMDPVPNGLRILDTCASPCCGCAELEVITQDLERLGSEVRAVQSFADELRKSVETMRDVVLSARIGDRGCSTCT